MLLKSLKEQLSIENEISQNIIITDTIENDNETQVVNNEIEAPQENILENTK